MLTYIASDSQTVATRLRHALVQHGHDCSISNVVTIERSATVLSTVEPAPNLIFFVLPDDVERGLSHLRQLCGETPARVIAVGAANDPSRILSAVHAGADDYIDEGGDFHGQLAAAMGRLQSKNELPTSACRTTVVTSASGGGGSSVIAANLAVLFAQQCGTCGLVDLDTRKGDLATLLNLRPRHTIADLYRNLNSLDQNMLEQSLTSHECGMRLLAAPDRVSDMNGLPSEAVRRILQLLQSVFSELVVDLPDPWDSVNNGLLQSADTILVPFRMDFPVVRNLRRLLDHWDELGINGEHVRLIANFSGQSNRLPADKVATALRTKVFHFIPDDPRSVNLSVNCGTPLVLECPRSSSAKSLRELSKSLNATKLAQSEAPQETADERESTSMFAPLARSLFYPLITKASDSRFASSPSL